MTERYPAVLRPEHPSARPLPELVAEFGLEYRGAIGGIELTGVSINSEEVEPGDLYVAVAGAKRHGAEFAASAKERGAVALLTDPSGLQLAEDVGLPAVVVDSPREALGAIASWVYRTNEHPPRMFAVTGTNGKTSTSYLLAGMLRQLGMVPGLSTTAERQIGDLTVPSRLTTPEASELHSMLARMRESGVRAVVLEVSAQALTRHRVDGLVFDVVGFTNLSHDHLDDYADMEEYFQAKLPLFDPSRSRRGVVSLDSPWGSRLADEVRIPFSTVSSLPDADADWRVEILEEQATHTEFTLTGPEGRSLTTRVPIIGRHMAANAALAIVMLVEGGFDLAAIEQALDVDGGIVAYLPGRMERVSGERGPAAYVDYGHSPDAFRNILEAVRRFTPGRVIMLFGADGDRDTTKRHDMGRIAAEGSDVLIITDYNPRFEDPAAIRSTLLEGARQAEHQPELHEVSPPSEAIRFAVSLAREGDSILWAGPGDEEYTDIEGVRTPQSARELARDALREAGW